MQAICHIFGAGTFYGLPDMPSPDDLIIAADGGYAHALSCGLSPNLVIGDFDSLETAPPKGAIKLPVEKDLTDMAAAIELGIERGYSSFNIYGGTGGRIDHTLANIQCLAALAQKGIRAQLFDQQSVITAICNESIRFAADAEGTISAFSHGDSATGVCEIGLKYPLMDATLQNTFPLGVSNAFTGAPAEITVGRGTLIVVYPLSARKAARA